MKRLVIITSRSEKTAAWQERGRYVQEFCDAVAAELTDVEVRFTTYQDLIFTVRNGELTVFDMLDESDLRTAAFVHFKNWTNEPEDAASVALYLRSHHVPFLNSEVDTVPAEGKLTQMFRLSLAGLPVPDTLYAHKRRLLDMLEDDQLADGFQFPLILKANDGSRGDDNHLVRTAQEAIRILRSAEADKEFVLQNFIENDGDYRLLFVGGSTPLVFRRTAAGGSHLNNTSKGGSGSFVPLHELPDSFLPLARKSIEVLRREIGGVDIIVDKRTGKPYILEVNGTPALATGYGVPEKTALFIELIRQQLGESA